MRIRQVYILKDNADFRFRSMTVFVQSAISYVNPFCQIVQLISQWLWGHLLLFLFAPVPFPVIWAASAYYIILSEAHAEMSVIHLSIFPMSAEGANQTNIIFQNATFVVKAWILQSPLSQNVLFIFKGFFPD